MSEFYFTDEGKKSFHPTFFHSQIWMRMVCTRLFEVSLRRLFKNLVEISQLFSFHWLKSSQLCSTVTLFCINYYNLSSVLHLKLLKLGKNPLVLNFQWNSRIRLVKHVALFFFYAFVPVVFSLTFPHKHKGSFDSLSDCHTMIALAFFFRSLVTAS